MLRCWRQVDGRLSEAGPEACAGALWIELTGADAAERARAGELLGIELPDPAEMHGAPQSRRFREVDGHVLFTVRVALAADGPSRLEPFVLVLGRDRLASLAAEELPALHHARRRLSQPTPRPRTATRVLLTILESLVEELAGSLEAIKRANDAASRGIFAHARGDGERGPLRRLLGELGRNGDLLSDIRESVADLQHLLEVWAEAEDDGVVPEVPAGEAARRERLAHDLAAVADRTGFLRGEIGLLLDAAMGFLAYEQNESIRIFTVLATLFMPPTLIASIYGMNFRHMPELEWTFGYPLALLLMLASALFTRWWFRRRGLL